MLSASRAQLTSDNERPRVNTTTNVEGGTQTMESRAQTSAECLIRLIEEFRQTDFPRRLPGFHGSIGPRERNKMKAEEGRIFERFLLAIACSL